MTRNFAPLKLLLVFLLLGALMAALMPAASAQDLNKEWWGAIKRDDVATLTKMLNRGAADPKSLNELGNPALTQAIREQSWRAYDLLLQSKKTAIEQPNTHDETPLMYLSIVGATERAEALIKAGAQVNRLGWTPLHYAAARAQLDTARMLVRHKAIINAPGPDGTTPLMMAARSGKIAMARYLLEQGADPTMFNKDGLTAADWASANGHTSMAKRLQETAAQVNLARHEPAPKPSEQAPEVAPEKADLSSFSRYFDLSKYEDTPPGR